VAVLGAWRRLCWREALQRCGSWRSYAAAACWYGGGLWGSYTGASGAPSGGGEFGNARWWPCACFKWRMAGVATRRLKELLRRGGVAAGGLLRCVPAEPWWHCWLWLSGVRVNDAVEAWWAMLGHLLLVADTLSGGICMASGENLAAVTPLGATLLLGGVDLITAVPSFRREVL
jgi:hypothetical protein